MTPNLMEELTTFSREYTQATLDRVATKYHFEIDSDLVIAESSFSQQIRITVRAWVRPGFQMAPTYLPGSITNERFFDERLFIGWDDMDVDQFRSVRHISEIYEVVARRLKVLLNDLIICKIQESYSEVNPPAQNRGRDWVRKQPVRVVRFASACNEE